MSSIADILLAAGALAAAFYCFVLSRKLNGLRSAEDGIGVAVSALSAQVDELNRSVTAARKSAESTASDLAALTDRAEGVSRRLELMVASMHDIPETDTRTETPEQPIFSTRMRRAGAQ